MNVAAVRLKQTRIAQGLNQAEFAEILGVKQSFLSAMERGTRKVSMKVANKLIEQFQVPANWLFDSSSNSSISTNVPITRTPSRTPKAEKTSSLTSKKPKSATNQADSKDQNRQNNLLKADAIRNTVEAAAVGGEAAQRWHDRRVLELRLQKQDEGVYSEGLTECFVASSFGFYSDQLLKHLHIKTQHQIDLVLDQVIDKQIKQVDAIAKIKTIVEPFKALKESFYKLESHITEMAEHIIAYYPEMMNEVELGPIDQGDFGWQAGSLKGVPYKEEGPEYSVEA